MSDGTICTECGNVMTGLDENGLCATCLMALAMSTTVLDEILIELPDVKQPIVGKDFGPFHIISILGKGGTHI